MRDDAERLIANYTQQWTALQADFPDYYYVVRNRFNRSRQPEDLNFLMRTCVNGIVRFNKKGEFNNSFHLSRKGMLPERFANIVRRWSTHIRGIHFHQGVFEETTTDARTGDFVYLDPPYAGNKQRYIADINVDRFLVFLDDLNHRGIKWALSFDGERGHTAYDYRVPSELYKRKELLVSGHSAVNKILNGQIEKVAEALYLNY